MASENIALLYVPNREKYDSTFRHPSRNGNLSEVRLQIVSAGSQQQFVKRICKLMALSWFELWFFKGEDFYGEYRDELEPRCSSIFLIGVCLSRHVVVLDLSRL